MASAYRWMKLHGTTSLFRTWILFAAQGSAYLPPGVSTGSGVAIEDVVFCGLESADLTPPRSWNITPPLSKPACQQKLTCNQWTFMGALGPGGLVVGGVVSHLTFKSPIQTTSRLTKSPETWKGGGPGIRGPRLAQRAQHQKVNGSTSTPSTSSRSHRAWAGTSWARSRSPRCDPACL